MKKTALFLSFAALIMLAGCSKEKKCMCTSDILDDHGNPTVTYIHVESSMRCSKITKLGFERQIEGQLVRNMEDVVCTDAKD